MNFSSDPIHTTENLIAKNKTKSISIYLVVVLAALTVLALLPIIRIDISSQSRGIVRSKTDNVPITSLVNGKITSIQLRNNQLIFKGDTLFTVSKENLEAEKELQDTITSSVNALLEDVTRIVNNNTSLLKTPTYKEDFYKFQAQKNELQSKVAQAQLNFNRNKALYEKQVIAKAEYEKFLYELQFANQALQSFVKQQKATWENQKQELEERVKSLEGGIEKITIEAKNYTVLAPISGTIENFSGLQVGSFVNASQTIATLSPNDNLIVESTVSPNDIGLLKRNQKVKFQMDAFNYNQWGLLEGEIIDIDKNVTLQENQTYFKVRCSILTKELALKSGYKTSISKGMTLTTRYIITRRSLYELLFDKMDDWLNPKIL
ncbi:MAG: HlyD family efflux transporter periplasmic adaptor subunit [Flavobacterium sp.]|nr:HlyD family efflux transporter periplasmic adaptor subunit [Flavobacterium sp.]